MLEPNEKESTDCAVGGDGQKTVSLEGPAKGGNPDLAVFGENLTPVVRNVGM